MVNNLKKNSDCKYIPVAVDTIFAICDDQSTLFSGLLIRLFNICFICDMPFKRRSEIKKKHI